MSKDKRRSDNDAVEKLSKKQKKSAEVRRVPCLHVPPACE
jgi:hypothetical protein